jgi:S-DNA-T family DNA segregation ATPase FtsK/SpoIIIE
VIFLSWIQNLFDKFKKEEEVNDEEYQPKNEMQSIPALKMGAEGSRDMDARITYQYPKGRFRFPLIPDDNKQKTEQQPHAHREKRGNENKHTRQETAAAIETVQFSKESRTIRHSSSRPFRPTEIPSPIFGFNRPRPQVVEHELSHFAVPNSPANQETKNDSIHYPPVQKDASASADLAEEKTQEIFNQNINSYPIVAESNKDAIITSAEALLFTVEAEVSQENSISAPALLSEETVEETIKEIVEEEENVPALQMAALKPELVQMAEKTEGAAIAHSQLAATPEQTKLDESGREEKQEEPKRSHLPFNVLMLKQDKQKWEDQKKVTPAKQDNIILYPRAEATESFEPPVPLTPAQEAELPKERIFRQEAGDFEFPSYQLLNPPVTEVMDKEWIIEQEQVLNQTLENFNVGAKVVNVTQGPSVTRFEVQPEPGVKVNKVTNLADDIKLSLAARDIRIEAPIPGKHTIGIEVPNQKSRPVLISEIIQSRIFNESSSPLTAVLGLDISGKPIVTDLKKMPHGLIAGATGSGKSVCINSILVSLLYKASPEDLKLLLIDPKMVELAPYNRIPHLVSPVITDVKAATAALKWAVEEMERRYELFAHTGVRDINRFNELALQHKQYSDKLPFIVIVIDELADLMMMSPADVEEAICRIAQKARACGIHLIIATQRPSVDVITGLIKANVPTRVAFSVSSQIDSRTIIDISGAEKLLGRGDMLFLENGSSKPVRLQGTFVSDQEIDFVVGHVREQREPDYLFEQEELLKKAQVSEEEDELFYEACEFVVDQACASTSSLQRRFKIGYNRAARLMDLMEQQGYISGAKGSKPREVFISASDLESIQEVNM